MSDVCGLPLNEPLPENATPLCAVVIVKALDEDGDPAYYSRATAGLSTVEAMGMIRYAETVIEASWHCKWHKDCDGDH